MLIMEELYDALKAGNVPDDKARAAAREVAKYTTDIQDLRSDVKLLKGMVGYLVAVSTAMLVMLGRLLLG